MFITSSINPSSVKYDYTKSCILTTSFRPFSSFNNENLLKLEFNAYEDLATCNKSLFLTKIILYSLGYPKSFT